MNEFNATTTFIKTVALGSFTRAAYALELPKSRVSQRVGDLEQHLGLPLLNRDPRSLALTCNEQTYFTKC